MPTSTEDLPGPAQQVLRDADRAIGQTQVPRARQLRLRDIIRLAVQQAGPHHLPAFAGNLTYNAFLASMGLVVLADTLFAFLLAWELMSLVSYFLVMRTDTKFLFVLVNPEKYSPHYPPALITGLAI